MNITITLYVTAGDENRVFGYTNDELKKAIGLRLNRELFLAYLIIYDVMTLFYETTSGGGSADLCEDRYGH